MFSSRGAFVFFPTAPYIQTSSPSRSPWSASTSHEVRSLSQRSGNSGTPNCRGGTRTAWSRAELLASLPRHLLFCFSIGSRLCGSHIAQCAFCHLAEILRRPQSRRRCPQSSMPWTAKTLYGSDQRMPLLPPHSYQQRAVVPKSVKRILDYLSPDPFCRFSAAGYACSHLSHFSPWAAHYAVPLKAWIGS